MRAHRFQPAFDFLGARITLSDMTPVASAGSSSVLMIDDGNSTANTDVNLPPGSEGTTCTGIDWVAGDQTTINVNDPVTTTATFVP